MVYEMAPSDANYQEQVIRHLAKCGTPDLSWTLHLFWARQRGLDVLKAVKEGIAMQIEE
jgi:hypothetical protein